MASFLQREQARRKRAKRAARNADLAYLAQEAASSQAAVLVPDAPPAEAADKQRELLRAEALAVLAQDAEAEADRARAEARAAADILTPRKKQTALSAFFQCSAPKPPSCPPLAAFVGARGARPQYALTPAAAQERRGD